jgi:hypothetical protein
LGRACNLRKSWITGKAEWADYAEKKTENCLVEDVITGGRAQRKAPVNGAGRDEPERENRIM